MEMQPSGLYLLVPNVLVGKNCYERRHLIGAMSQHRQRAPPDAQSKDDSLQRYILSPPTILSSSYTIGTVYRISCCKS